MIPARARNNLVIVRAGDASLHPGWITDPNREFDLFVSYYGNEPDRYRSDADLYEMRPGPKWPSLAALLREQPELVDRYRAFWLPDDDLLASSRTIDRMFALFRGFGLALAQPALSRDSYVSWPHLLVRPELVLRYVSFVEIMAPVFDREALEACVGTFGESPSGWGLDWIWPTLLGRDRLDAIAVIDATPVKHTRPLGGELYQKHPNLDPGSDEALVLERFGQAARRARGVDELLGVVARAKPGLRLSLGAWLRRLRWQRRVRRERQSEEFR